MGRVVVVEHVTLDGVMQGPARPDEDSREGFALGGWAAARSDPKMQAMVGARMGASWSLLVGRRTYEDFANVWPGRPKPNPMGEALTNVQKFVASRTLAEPLPWQNSTLLRGDAVEGVANLRREHEHTLIVFGSGVLVQSLMRANLIDEYLLQIHPLVLGRGRRLFSADGPLVNLTLIDATSTAGGVVIAAYRAG